MPTRGEHGVIISAGIYTYFLTNVTPCKLSFLAGRASGIEVAREFQRKQTLLFGYLSTAMTSKRRQILNLKRNSDSVETTLSARPFRAVPMHWGVIDRESTIRRKTCSGSRRPPQNLRPESFTLTKDVGRRVAQT